MPIVPIAVFFLSVGTGLRTMTPIAVLCWFAYLGFLPLGGTWGFWAGTLVSAVVFSVFAVGEWVGDKLPQTPNRTELFPLLARLSFGGLVGALVATAMHVGLPAAIVAGVVGAAAGTYGGLGCRRACAGWVGRDLPVAVAEDGVALLLAVVGLHLVSR